MKSRPAKVADKLTSKNFGLGTTGFCASEDSNVAVCVLPGTELAFDVPVARRTPYAWSGEQQTFVHKTAIFRQTNKDEARVHHDCLEFPDGDTVMLTFLAEDQTATVLQLPAVPKTEAEREAQTRVVVTA